MQILVFFQFIAKNFKFYVENSKLEIKSLDNKYKKIVNFNSFLLTVRQYSFQMVS